MRPRKREKGRKRRRRRSEWKLNRDDFLRGIVMSLRTGGADGGRIYRTHNQHLCRRCPMAYDATKYPLLSSLLFDLDIWTTERREGGMEGGRTIRRAFMQSHLRETAASGNYDVCDARDASHDYRCGDFGAAQTRTDDVIDS